jgi:benzoate/toluate 1,2-dioxygenase alpha subunit
MEQRERLVSEFGEARADWMIKNSRNLCLYPNVFLMDQFSSQIRVFRPPAPDRTEVTIYCIAPRGESAEARAAASASTRTSSTPQAWPPRTIWKNSAPARKASTVPLPWNDMSRGAEHWVEGPDEEADKINLKPILSGIKTEDEGLYVAQHSYWLEQMHKALQAEQAQAQ